MSALNKKLSPEAVNTFVSSLLDNAREAVKKGQPIAFGVSVVFEQIFSHFNITTSSLPFSIRQCPILATFVSLQSRVTARVATALCTRPVVTLFDIEEEVCLAEGVTSFAELCLGLSILSLEIVQHTFKCLPTTTVPQVRSSQFIHFLLFNDDARQLLESGADALALVDAFAKTVGQRKGRNCGIHIQNLSWLLALLRNEADKTLQSVRNVVAPLADVKKVEVCVKLVEAFADTSQEEISKKKKRVEELHHLDEVDASDIVVEDTEGIFCENEPIIVKLVPKIQESTLIVDPVPKKVENTESDKTGIFSSAARVVRKKRTVTGTAIVATPALALSAKEQAEKIFSLADFLKKQQANVSPENIFDSLKKITEGASNDAVLHLASIAIAEAVASRKEMDVPAKYRGGFSHELLHGDHNVFYSTVEAYRQELKAISEQLFGVVTPQAVGSLVLGGSALDVVLPCEAVANAISLRSEAPSMFTGYDCKGDLKGNGMMGIVPMSNFDMKIAQSVSSMISVNASKQKGQGRKGVECDNGFPVFPLTVQVHGDCFASTPSEEVAEEAARLLRSCPMLVDVDQATKWDQSPSIHSVWCTSLHYWINFHSVHQSDGFVLKVVGKNTIKLPTPLPIHDTVDKMVAAIGREDYALSSAVLCSNLLLLKEHVSQYVPAFRRLKKFLDPSIAFTQIAAVVGTAPTHFLRQLIGTTLSAFFGEVPVQVITHGNELKMGGVSHHSEEREENEADLKSAVVFQQLHRDEETKVMLCGDAVPLESLIYRKSLGVEIDASETKGGGYQVENNIVAEKSNLRLYIRCLAKTGQKKETRFSCLVAEDFLHNVVVALPLMCRKKNFEDVHNFLFDSSCEMPVCTLNGVALASYSLGFGVRAEWPQKSKSRFVDFSNEKTSRIVSCVAVLLGEVFEHCCVADNIENIPKMHSFYEVCESIASCYRPLRQLLAPELKKVFAQIPCVPSIVSSKCGRTVEFCKPSEALFPPLASQHCRWQEEEITMGKIWATDEIAPFRLLNELFGVRRATVDDAVPSLVASASDFKRYLRTMRVLIEQFGVEALGEAMKSVPCILTTRHDLVASQRNDLVWCDVDVAVSCSVHQLSFHLSTAASQSNEVASLLRVLGLKKLGADEAMVSLLVPQFDKYNDGAIVRDENKATLVHLALSTAMCHSEFPSSTEQFLEGLPLLTGAGTIHKCCFDHEGDTTEQKSVGRQLYFGSAFAQAGNGIYPPMELWVPATSLLSKSYTTIEEGLEKVTDMLRCCGVRHFFEPGMAESEVQLVITALMASATSGSDNQAQSVGGRAAQMLLVPPQQRQIETSCAWDGLAKMFFFLGTLWRNWGDASAEFKRFLSTQQWVPTSLGRLVAPHGKALGTSSILQFLPPDDDDVISLPPFVDQLEEAKKSFLANKRYFVALGIATEPSAAQLVSVVKQWKTRPKMSTTLENVERVFLRLSSENCYEAPFAFVPFHSQYKQLMKDRENTVVTGKLVPAAYLCWAAREGASLVEQQLLLPLSSLYSDKVKAYFIHCGCAPVCTLRSLLRGLRAFREEFPFLPVKQLRKVQSALFDVMNYLAPFPIDCPLLHRMQVPTNVGWRNVRDCYFADGLWAVVVEDDEFLASRTFSLPERPSASLHRFLTTLGMKSLRDCRKEVIFTTVALQSAAQIHSIIVSVTPFVQHHLQAHHPEWYFNAKDIVAEALRSLSVVVCGSPKAVVEVTGTQKLKVPIHALFVAASRTLFVSGEHMHPNEIAPAVSEIFVPTYDREVSDEVVQLLIWGFNVLPNDSQGINDRGYKKFVGKVPGEAWKASNPPHEKFRDVYPAGSDSFKEQLSNNNNRGESAFVPPPLVSTAAAEGEVLVRVGEKRQRDDEVLNFLTSPVYVTPTERVANSFAPQSLSGDAQPSMQTAHYARQAEEFVAADIRQEVQALGPEHEVEWVNERTESGFPFDVVHFIRDATTGAKHVVRYIEVKSTISSDRSRAFDVTLRELVHAARYGQSFWIYRVFNAASKNFKKMKVEKLQDPIELWRRGTLNATGNIRLVMT